tara:strand:- start:1101 stop:2273 length:1173 start_codon:yes stop_codon:yes gene_type:complete
MSGSGQQEPLHVVVWAAKENASSLHSALKTLGWHYPLAQSKANHTGEIGFPCRQQKECSTDEIEALNALFDSPWQISLESVQTIGPSVNPHERLKEAVMTWYATNGLVETDPTSYPLPQKWELLGDLVVLPTDAFDSTQWSKLLEGMGAIEKEKLFSAVAEALGGHRLARQHQIQDNITRSPQLTLLHGDSGWVEFTDHGVKFGFDAEHVMFSSGNVTERHRIGSIDMTGEIVIDAYAGTGYYTLPMLARSGAAHVHACELNPASIAGLVWGAQANGVEQRLTVHHGDNQETLPSLRETADRCHLGLLPSSEAVWGHALACLKPSGGWLHIHMNIEKDNLEAWCDEALVSLKSRAKAMGRNWTVSCHHLERVKSYSPGVLHVVLDVHCSA